MVAGHSYFPPHHGSLEVNQQFYQPPQPSLPCDLPYVPPHHHSTSRQSSSAFELCSCWDFLKTSSHIEPIRNFFAALFLASIGMLIHVHFIWNHVDILLASVILVIIVKTVIIGIVVKGFRYSNKTSFLVGMSLAQIGEFAFVLLSRASNLHLVEGKLYGLLLGTTAFNLVTTPLLFKLIPAVVHLGIQNEMGFKGG